MHIPLRLGSSERHTFIPGGAPSTHDFLTLLGQMHEVNLSRTRRTVELVMGIVD